MSDSIDLAYLPRTYFRPLSLERHLLSQVKGAVLKRRVQALFDQGLHEEVKDLLGDHGIPARDRKALEAFHPMFMGGNYLPDAESGEVEIARISIESTTFDVTCVYARAEDGHVHYRVVDEYGGETLTGPAELTSAQPLTLAELADFFLTAWPLQEVLEMNFEGDLDGQLGFFRGESTFYPAFDALCRERVVKAFDPPASDGDTNG